MPDGVENRFSDNWLSVAECAEFFGCSCDTMKKRLHSGAIPSRVFWRKRYVHRADLERFLEEGDPTRVRRVHRPHRRAG